MVDRDLVLYNSRVLIEYLDERFPHPPLMPVDPVSRAKSRLALFRIESDWFSLLGDIERGTEKKKTLAKKALTESLINSAEVFSAMPYFLSADSSIETKQDSLKALAKSIELASAMLNQALVSGHKIMACGNGGSASDAQHFYRRLLSIMINPGETELRNTGQLSVDRNGRVIRSLLIATYDKGIATLLEQPSSQQPTNSSP